jgi:hypothetical protein
LEVNVTGWSRGLEVTGGDAGVVSHAGLVLLRHLADKTGLAGGLSAALASPRILVHDRGRVLADLACAIADGAPGDLRFPGDVRSAGAVRAGGVGADGVADAGRDSPWRRPRGPAGHRGGEYCAAACVGAGRGRHGALPGVRLADKVLDGVVCIRLDATVTIAHSDKELAEANFKGYGLLTELRAESSQFSGHSRAALATVPAHGR